jgi:hypothetical protein
MSSIDSQKNSPKGLNLMDLVELVIAPTLGLYLLYRNYFAEKINPIEIVIIIYLGWEFFKKLKKFLNNKSAQ